MPTAAEGLGTQSEMKAVLDAGIEQVSQKQEVIFQRYQKFVLQQDGFVFWSATPEFMTVVGSLHYATDRVQAEDETLGSNQVLLSSETEITQFNLVNPLSMWIGSWPISGSAPLQVAFAQRGSYFQESDVWHYSGFCVYPALKSQIINSFEDLPSGPIVSNSLPIWLAQTTFVGQTVPVYPSFLVPDNIVPPYIVAHIEPAGTISLGAFPIIGPWPGVVEPNSGASQLHDLASSQLMRDRVILTLYGFSNQMALQYLQSLIEASIDETAPFGFANSPAVEDAKRVQVEIAALAQKKTIEILANYYQGAADVVARRLILFASVGTVAILGGRGAFGQGSLLQDEQLVTAMGTVIE